MIIYNKNVDRFIFILFSIIFLSITFWDLSPIYGRFKIDLFWDLFRGLLYLISHYVSKGKSKNKTRHCCIFSYYCSNPRSYICSICGDGPISRSTSVFICRHASMHHCIYICIWPLALSACIPINVLHCPWALFYTFRGVCDNN